MTSPPRASAPTVPPEPPGIRNKLKSFLDWKAAVVALIGAGFVIRTYSADIATRTELSREHTFEAGQHETINLKLDKTATRLDVLDEGDRWRDAALTAIAQKLGVYVPPSPTLLKP